MKSNVLFNGIFGRIFKIIKCVVFSKKMYVLFNPYFNTMDILINILVNILLNILINILISTLINILINI